ncbi:MAG: hypothetical protein IKI99_04645, partial [Firmicutes bacterium]|nr:hypothetical protein [Bacillota bacterium]
MKIKKVISLAMCLILLLTTVFVPGVDSFAAEQAVEIRLKDEKIETLTLEDHQKEVLAATVQGMVFPSYQWQILIDEETQSWVDIYDKKESECEISYPVVKHAMDEKGNAYIRCVVEKGANQIYSDIVHVIIKVDTIEEQSSQVTSFSQTRYVATTDASPSKAVSGPAGGSRAVNSDLVTITIKYLDVVSLKDGEAESAIYSPYTATIEKGKVFSQGAEGIISPTFIGFAPYLDSNQNGQIDDGDTKADIVYVPNEPINEDLTICVYYKPIPVNYSVKYYFQNIHDDLYTEDPNLQFSAQAETGTIIKNEFLEEKGGNPEGFTKMYHIPESVAADGSTVFECYYDRNYYMMQFDLQGGYGVDPIYARYGTPFVVNDPVKHGYTFAGWQLKSIDREGDGIMDSMEGVNTSGIASQIPAYNCYYEAQWTRNSTTYTTVYWLKNSKGGYDYLESKTGNALSGDYVSCSQDDKDAKPLICGNDGLHTHVTGCSAEFEKGDSNVLVEGDGSTVVNVYYKPKTYTLKFYYAIENVTKSTYWVIGGTTYFFGAKTESGLPSLPSDRNNEVGLMMHYLTNKTGDNNANAQLGQVDELPKLNAAGLSRGYTQGRDDTYNGNKIIVDGNQYYFHYISFTASYGQDLSNLWPCAVFDSVTRTTANTHGNWSGKEAFISAWNGEHNVWYTKNNANQTIKGNYKKLDYKLLFERDPENYDDVVAYACFWENGANVGWSVPELYVYKIWVPVLEGESTEGIETTERNGKTYRLMESYDTCDDSDVGSQTPPAMEGYVFQEKVGTSFT